MAELEAKLRAIASAGLSSRDRKRLQWQAVAAVPSKPQAKDVAQNKAEEDYSRSPIDVLDEAFAVTVRCSTPVDTISQFKELLLSYGDTGRDMFRQIERLRKARNARAHPGRRLLAELEQLLSQPPQTCSSSTTSCGDSDKDVVSSDAEQDLESHLSICDISKNIYDITTGFIRLHACLGECQSTCPDMVADCPVATLPLHPTRCDALDDAWNFPKTFKSKLWDTIHEEEQTIYRIYETA